jgi:hypothetical protein
MKKSLSGRFIRVVGSLGFCLSLTILAWPQGGAGTFHAFYTAADVNLSGDLIHLYTSSGTWHYDDLTSLTTAGPPAAGSPLTSFSDSAGQHIFYFKQNGSLHVFQLYWQRSNSSWHDQDLTVAASSATLPDIGAGTTSFGDNTGSEHLSYQGTDQNVHHLYFNLNWGPG